METHTHTHTHTHSLKLVVKNLPANAADIRDADSVLGLGRSPGGGHGDPLQYSCLETPMNEEPNGLQSIGLQRAQLLEDFSFY